MNYCTKCGAELRQGDEFCGKCGARAVGEETRRVTPPAGDRGDWQPTAAQRPVAQRPVAQPYAPAEETAGGTVGGGVVALGVLGIVFAVLFPLVAYPLSIVGLVLGNKELQTGKTTKTYGRTLNTIGLVIACINSLAGICINLF